MSDKNADKLYKYIESQTGLYIYIILYPSG